MAKFDGKITAIIGMMADKDCDEVLAKTLRFCKKAVAVEVEGMPRSLKAEELKQKAKKYCETEIAQNYQEAIEKAKGEDVIFVFGSLYLASAMREKLKNFFKV
jgi:folylpolyglutamate synthase/dihydropteroate synthase